MNKLKPGIERFNAGRFAEALRLFRAARPAGPEARCFEAHALVALGRPEEALSAFVDAVEAFPAYAPAYEGLAALALRRAPSPRGRGWRRLRALKPRGPAARRLLAGALSSCAQGFLAAGSPEAAQAALLRLLALEPRNARTRRRLIELHRLRAQEAAAREELAAAERRLRAALKLAPADAESRRLLAGHLRLLAHEQETALKPGPAVRALRRAVAAAPRDARSRRRLGELLHQRGMEQQRGGRLDAADSLRAALALQPRDVKSRHRLLELLRARALALAAGGRTDLAERTLRRALSVDPKDREARRRLLELLRGPADLRALRRALAFEPRDDESRRLLVELLRARLEAALAADSPARTAAAVRAALAFSKNDREARLRLAALLRARGVDALFARDLKRAGLLFRLVLRCDPGDPAACMSLAAVMNAAGLGAAERALLRKAAALARRRGALGEEFQALMKLGRGRDAVATAERILDGRPTLDDLRCFWDPWEWDERAPREEELLRALEDLERSLGPAPRGPWLHYYRGFLSGPEGLAHFERLDEFPAKRYGWMYFRAASTALLACEFERAAAWFRRCLAGEPADWRAHCFLAEACLCLGRPADAFAEMDRALRAAPESEAGQVLAWRGAFELWLGRYEGALALLDRAAALGAQCAYCWRGAALLKLGRPAEALAELDRTLTLFPLDFEAYVWRGEAKRALGRPREALEDLDERAAKDRDLATPVWLWARFNRALAKAALGDPAGMQAEFAAIPSAVIDHLRAKTGLEKPEDLLEAGLSLSRGFRRDEYGQAIWMRDASLG